MNLRQQRELQITELWLPRGKIIKKYYLDVEVPSHYLEILGLSWPVRYHYQNIHELIHSCTYIQTSA